MRRAGAILLGKTNVQADNPVYGILTLVAEKPAPHGVDNGRTPYSLTGYPCAVVRAGTSPNEMPVSVQIIVTGDRYRANLTLLRTSCLISVICYAKLWV